jgi:DNA-binding NtrC family response regulator
MTEPEDGRATEADVGASLGRPAAVRRIIVSVVDGPAKGKSWESEADVATLGSHPSCDLVLDDPTVSRFHCEIRIDGHHAVVRDKGSRNGTTVDGVPVVEAFLRDGSTLRLGRSVLRVDYGAAKARLALSNQTEMGSLVGVSIAMRATFALLERAAASDATVLLEGETGTGKTASARAIHERSARSAGPFVIVDCGAIPATLLESELFGHERGAFTGATERRIGAFEEATGGTLVLDEIGELPLDLQPKLLGVLESRTMRRVGANTVHDVDARIVASTNRDLRAEVNAGRFRSDLYYRLAVVKIAQPPLRERPEDVPILADRILRSLGADETRVRELLSPELVLRMRYSPWPGNIRELRNYLERCLVFDEALPLGDRTASTAPAATDAAAVYGDLPYAEARDRALSDFERAYLERLLAQHGAKVAAAAAAAGIDRTYFYRLLRRHGIRP